MKSRVLFVDDDIEFLDVARILFQQSNPKLELVVASSVQKALELLENEKFDVVIADYLMPDATGLDLLEALRCTNDDIGFIVWTGHSEEEIVIKALNLGADYYILKGADFKEQFKSIREVVERLIHQKKQNHEQRKDKAIPAIIASEFMHTLSHDVTGVLQNIMGYTALLEEEFNETYVQGISRLATKLTERMKQAVLEIDEGKLYRK